jgi:hypothetical protein
MKMLLMSAALFVALAAERIAHHVRSAGSRGSVKTSLKEARQVLI